MPDSAGRLSLPALARVEPPPLPRADFHAPLAVGVGVILATITAHFVNSNALPVPECRWLHWTGIPCPGCGATRCLGACGRLDFAAALFWNPLVALTVGALLGWSALALGAAWLGKTLPVSFHRVLTGRRLVALVLLNWLYLCWVLPR